MAINKGFIKDWAGNKILPITRGELVLDANGNVALTSEQFLAGENGNKFGLITAAERAMLNGGGTGNSLADVYTKVGHINSGLQFNGNTLNFYNTSTGAATPINITASTTNGISLTNSGNTVSLSLATLTTSGLSATNILKSITVDKFGRVTAVTGAALTNAELPPAISGKTISNTTLSGCTTSDKEIGTNEKAIVNKAYVDAKFAEVNGIATGALTFKGSIKDATEASNYLTSANANTYYKATGEFNLNVSDLYDATGISGTTVKVKVGDTLIVYPKGNAVTYVYIPSGDDITAITVRGEGETADAITSQVGEVTLKFSSMFNVKNPTQGSKIAQISLKQASASQSGYLSSTDYAKFSAYADKLSVSYTSKFTSGAGVYEIGTLNIGGTDHTIYGKNNITALALTNGASNEYNPILKFTENGVDTSFTLKGGNSIKVKKNGNAVEFTVVNEVDTNSAKYAEFDSTTNKLKIKIGSVSGNTVTNGLTDYEEFVTLRQNVITRSLEFELITNSLTDTSKDFYYGSTDLRDAITLTI